MDKSLFSMIFRLQKKQPWLCDKEDQVMSLLYQDCKSVEQRELLIELLDRFIFLKDTDFNAAINILCDQIVNDPNLESHNTQIVSLTADSFADSGQSILYALKVRLEKRGWREHLLINRYGSSFKEYNRNKKQHHNIVFVDEYIGSGQTVISRFNAIKNQYTGIEITMKFHSIAASSVGLEKLKLENINAHCIYEIKRGISDYCLNKTVAEKNLLLMNNIEEILSASYNGKDLPKNGYGNTESLYAREEGNTPNSVFPIFWWPFYNDESSRKTLLFRAMRDA